MPKNLRVLFVGAMETDIAGSRAYFGSVSSGPIHGAYPFWTSGGDGLEVGILLTRVGETNAAIATPEAIRRFSSDVVLKIGCVGGQPAGIRRASTRATSSCRSASFMVGPGSPGPKPTTRPLRMRSSGRWSLASGLIKSIRPTSMAASMCVSVRSN